jgi:hypothetical protein
VVTPDHHHVTMASTRTTSTSSSGCITYELTHQSGPTLVPFLQKVVV